MYQSFVGILTFYGLNLLVNGSEVSETNIAEELAQLDKCLEAKLAAFGDQLMTFDGKLKRFNHEIAIVKDKQADLEKKKNEINEAVNKVKADVKNMNAPKEKNFKNIVKNSIDMEVRVNDEISDVKLSLAAIADDVDRLEEAENIQNQNILLVQQDINFFPEPSY